MPHDPFLKDAPAPATRKDRLAESATIIADSILETFPRARAYVMLLDIYEKVGGARATLRPYLERLRPAAAPGAIATPAPGSQLLISEAELAAMSPRDAARFFGRGGRVRG